MKKTILFVCIILLLSACSNRGNQTDDDRYYGYGPAPGGQLKWTEYRNTFEKHYKLLGNNMVLNQRDSEAYRVNWSLEHVVSEADMDDFFVGSAYDAVDLGTEHLANELKELY